MAIYHLLSWTDCPFGDFCIEIFVWRVYRCPFQGMDVCGDRPDLGELISSHLDLNKRGNRLSRLPLFTSWQKEDFRGHVFNEREVTLGSYFRYTQENLQTGRFFILIYLVSCLFISFSYEEKRRILCSPHPSFIREFSTVYLENQNDDSTFRVNKTHE